MLKGKSGRSSTQPGTHVSEHVGYESSQESYDLFAASREELRDGVGWSSDSDIDSGSDTETGLELGQRGDEEAVENMGAGRERDSGKVRERVLTLTDNVHEEIKLRRQKRRQAVGRKEQNPALTVEEAATYLPDFPRLTHALLQKQQVPHSFAYFLQSRLQTQGTRLHRERQLAVPRINKLMIQLSKLHNKYPDRPPLRWWRCIMCCPHILAVNPDVVIMNYEGLVKALPAVAWERILEHVDAKLLLVSHKYVQQKVARQAVVLRHLLGINLFEALEECAVSLSSLLLVDPDALEARVKLLMEYMSTERVAMLIEQEPDILLHSQDSLRAAMDAMLHVFTCEQRMYRALWKSYATILMDPDAVEVGFDQLVHSMKGYSREYVEELVQHLPSVLMMGKADQVQRRIAYMEQLSDKVPSWREEYASLGPSDMSVCLGASTHRLNRLLFILEHEKDLDGISLLSVMLVNTKKWNKAFPKFSNWIERRDAYDVFRDIGVISAMNRRQLMLLSSTRHPAKYHAMLAKGAQGSGTPVGQDRWATSKTLQFSSDCQTEPPSAFSSSESSSVDLLEEELPAPAPRRRLRRDVLEFKKATYADFTREQEECGQRARAAAGVAAAAARAAAAVVASTDFSAGAAAVATEATPQTNAQKPNKVVSPRTTQTEPSLETGISAAALRMFHPATAKITEEDIHAWVEGDGLEQKRDADTKPGLLNPWAKGRARFEVLVEQQTLRDFFKEEFKSPT